MSVKSDTPPSSYPEGAALDRFVQKRNTTGSIWLYVFLAATCIGIIALAALLYNIVNSAFGLVAVQNQVDPAGLVLKVQEEKMLNAPNTLSSEDDTELVAGIAGHPKAIGFFGYAYYQANQDKLQALSIEGVTPSTQTAESGEYPIARPIFIYSAVQIMQSKPQVAAFINYYLTHVNEEIADVGYFPMSQELLDQSKSNWLQVTGQDREASFPAVNPAEVEGNIITAGSSTVYPLTQRLIDRFVAADYTGEITHELLGTTAGFRRFCLEQKADIANASRIIKAGERTACMKNQREPVEFRVGSDALVVVVSKENTFLANGNLTLEQLRQIFTTAENWSDVNPDWPNTPIERFIPGADSGTLDFFTETIFADVTLADLSKDELVNILLTTTDAQGRKTLVSKGKLRQLESEQRFYEDKFLAYSADKHAQECAEANPPARCALGSRDQADVLNLVEALVVAPDVVKSWSLVDSLFRREQIEAEATEQYPDAPLEFRAWLTPQFITDPQSSAPELAGVRTAILGSLWLIGITILIALPIGVGAAIYLEEYATTIGNPFLRRVNEIIQTNISNLAGVPSIIYGMLGLAVFVRVLEPLTSGIAFGAVTDPTTANGRTILSAALTMALLILPVLIINAQEAIRAVPQSLRQAGMGLGATKWQTIWAHVLPNAIPGILTGSILSISRAIGETAPLVVVGASTFITVDPSGPFSKFTALPIQIYQWTARPQDEYRNIAAAASIVLLVLLLSLNAVAIIMRNRYSMRKV
jgi:phosphate transport system permease protein